MFTITFATELRPNEWVTQVTDWSRSRIRVLLDKPFLEGGTYPRLRLVGPKHALMGVMLEKGGKHGGQALAENFKLGVWEHSLLPFVLAVQVGKKPFSAQRQEDYKAAFEMGLQLELQAPGQLAVRGDRSMASQWAQLYLEKGN